ncbi:MAG: YhdP family protein [Wenzhouxiangella sp.]
MILTTLAIVIIVTAIVVGIGRALIPYADEIRPWLAETLSQRIGQDVRIDRIEVQWPRLTPQLVLFGSSIGLEDEPLLEVDQARLELHLPDLFGAERNPFRLIVLGLDLVLAEDEQGRWGLQLEGGAQLGERPGRDQMLAGDLLVRDASLQIRPLNRPQLGARLVEGEIRRRGEQTLVHGLLQPVDYAETDIDFSLLLKHPDGRWEKAQAWLLAKDLVLDQWLGADWLPSAAARMSNARLSLEAWLTWSANGDGRLDVDLELGDLDLASATLQARLLASRQGRETQVELVSLQDPTVPGDPMISGLAVGRSSNAWALAIDDFDLGSVFDLVHPFLEGMAIAPSHLSGRISDLSAGWQARRGLHAMSGTVSQLGLRLPDPLPSVEALDLGLALAGDRLVLEPGGQPRVDWSGLLRGSVGFDALAGRLLLSRETIELQGIQVENEFMSGSANGWVYLSAERPFLDLVIEADRVESVDPRPYLPPDYVPEAALNWLDNSIDWIESAEGVVLLHLRSGTPATEIKPGNFQADVSFRGLNIDYWPDWPAARNMSGTARFLGTGLEGRIDDGWLGEVRLVSPEVSIADLTSPVLHLDLVAEPVDLGAIAGLIASLPLENWDDIMAPMVWTGEAGVGAQLTLPFADMENWWMEGELKLQGARFDLPAIPLSLARLEGSVRFDRDFIGPSQLLASAGGGKADRLTVDLNAGFSEPAWMRIETDFNPTSLIAENRLPEAVADALSGTSHFRIDLSSGGRGQMNIDISSDLRGMTLDLPAPLSKPADAAWPLALGLQVSDGQLQAQIGLHEWLNASFSSQPEGWRLGLGLNQEVPDLPTETGFRVRGHLEQMAVSEWIEMSSGFGNAVTLQPATADVAISLGRLDGLGLELEAIDLSVWREEQSWQIELVGDSIEGRLTVPIPLDSGRVVVADLRRLYLDPVVAEPRLAELEIHPLSDQTSSVSPRGLPPLHLLIEDLRWGDMNLGRARLESHAIAEGVEVELADVSGPDLRLHGRGRWIERDSRTHGEFQGRLTTGNLSGLLASAGYDSGVEASHAQIDADLRWPGAPDDFALGRLSGAFNLQIFDGSIPEARPGAGRLLGLASFSAMPRRLMLDFRDVFAAGLKFDEISGRFDLAAGFARTSGLVIRSPAATITITGDTDMAAREYDQIIVVEPGLGATLPLIGGLAGGPVGAAAGLVLRSLLERPLRGLAEARYSVTGSWDEPFIELVDARVADEAAVKRNAQSAEEN